MQWHDWLALALILLLAARAILRLRKQGSQGCNNNCAGCDKASSCSSQSKPGS